MTLQPLKTQLAIGVLAFSGLSAAHAAEPSFGKDILPLLQQNCVSCHITGEELGGLGLAPSLAYKQLVNADALQTAMARVKPGAPDESYLLHKLAGTHLDQGGTGGRMPLGFPALSTTQLELISRWIASGALNN
jgi:mono/diheme cytochrome c family protein